MKLLAILEFTSERKRSSVIARYVDPLTKKTRTQLFTKGADTMIEARLSQKVNQLELHQLDWNKNRDYSAGLKQQLELQNWIETKTGITPRDWNKK